MVVLPSHQPIPHAREAVEWLTLNGFNLLNRVDVPTYQSYDGVSLSTLDLTFVNTAGVDENIVRDHTIIPDLACGSDHFATVFSIGEEGTPILNMSEAKYNWKAADQNAFTKALADTLQEDPLAYDLAFGPLNRRDLDAVTPDEIDNAVGYFNACMTKAAEMSVPHRNPSQRSKPGGRRS
ncbi:hypothetical protein BS47DRAFT_1360083 [Hydnum rufescens UP504]|uniref:Endonuclease/exonuclease/phosphatase domain-containing protein n=1 Tax=Hydnum rufescens UP504 TaxID=1448309 RepID=A0A9P6E0C7_9AGAM|nr:hypothetical protein BS47DRAFT_1360083 [Hydnum rufescens UP504]